MHLCMDLFQFDHQMVAQNIAQKLRLNHLHESKCAQWDKFRQSMFKLIE